MVDWFQFTRPRGGAIEFRTRNEGKKGFNSHAPVGARYRNTGFYRMAAVSIHTPPWGRDEHAFRSQLAKQFQFTRPRGGAMGL